MPRIRSIHPDACKSERLATISAEAERCYWRLQTHCDDEGRCEDHARLIWAALFPLHEDVGPKDVALWLTELTEAGLLSRYEAAGVSVISVTQWGRFQHPNRPRPSTLPEDSLTAPVLLTEPSVSPQRVASAGEGVGEGVGEGDSDANASPSDGEEPKPRAKRSDAQRERDQVWDALTVCFGPVETKSEKSRRGKVVRELLEVGATPPGVIAAHAEAKRRGWSDFTEMALVTNWTSLRRGQVPTQGKWDRLAEADAARIRARAQRG